MRKFDPVIAFIGIVLFVAVVYAITVLVLFFTGGLEEYAHDQSTKPEQPASVIIKYKDSTFDCYPKDNGDVLCHEREQ